MIQKTEINLLIKSCVQFAQLTREKGVEHTGAKSDARQRISVLTNTCHATVKYSASADPIPDKQTVHMLVTYHMVVTEGREKNFTHCPNSWWRVRTDRGGLGNTFRGGAGNTWS